MKITVEFDEQEFSQFLEWRRTQVAPTSKSGQPEIDALPIHYLSISTYALHILNHHGVSTIGDARGKLDRELLNLPNFGRKSLNDLRDAIKAFDATHPKD